MALSVAATRPRRGFLGALTASCCGERAQNAVAVGVGVGAAVAVAAFAIGVVRLRHGWTGAFDLGVYDQAVWLLAHGHAQASLLQRHVLGDHMSLLMLLLVPLYWLKATPVWLLGVQAAALGAAVVPLRALARDEGASPALASALYVLSAPVLSAAVYDFHQSTVAVPFIAWLVVGARRGDRRLTALAALGVLVCRADLAVVIAAVALVARPNVRRLLLACAAAGAALNVVPALFGAGSVWGVNYANLGSGPVDAALHPLRALSAVTRVGSLAVLATWLVPTGFVLVRRPRWLAAVLLAGLPVLLIGKTFWWTGLFHYGAPLVPLAIGGVLAATTGPRRGLVSVVALAGSALTLLVMSPLSAIAPANLSLTHALRDGPYAHVPAAVLAAVGPHDVVSTNVFPRFSHRREVYDFPLPFVAGEVAGGPPSAARAARVDVVVVRSFRRAQVESFGFTRVVYDDGHLLVARRPPRP